MPEDLIRYDVLTQEALRGVIRKVLDEVSVAGLPGEHHFFITFDTNFPGVKLSSRMHERYPETMTIVIQHTFWNLKASESHFEVDLSFNDIRERLRIPYAAIQAFFDPSVKFGLQFDVSDAAIADALGDLASEMEEADQAAAAEPQGKDHKKKKEPEQAGSPAEKKEAEIVSLDSFRNKK